MGTGHTWGLDADSGAVIGAVEGSLASVLDDCGEVGLNMEMLEFETGDFYQVQLTLAQVLGERP